MLGSGHMICSLLEMNNNKKVVIVCFHHCAILHFHQHSILSWQVKELFSQLMLLTPTKSPQSLRMMWMDVVLPALHEHHHTHNSVFRAN